MYSSKRPYLNIPYILGVDIIEFNLSETTMSVKVLSKYTLSSPYNLWKFNRAK